MKFVGTRTVFKSYKEFAAYGRTLELKEIDRFHLQRMTDYSFKNIGFAMYFNTRDGAYRMEFDKKDVKELRTYLNQLNLR